MGDIFGLMITGYACLCFIGSELRLLWFCEDLDLDDWDPKDFPAQEYSQFILKKEKGSKDNLNVSKIKCVAS